MSGAYAFRVFPGVIYDVASTSQECVHLEKRKQNQHIAQRGVVSKQKVIELLTDISRSERARLVHRWPRRAPLLGQRLLRLLAGPF